MKINFKDVSILNKENGLYWADIRTIMSKGINDKGVILPNSQLDVALELCIENPNTLVVLQNGSPVTMPFLDDASAVLQVGLFGERGANSLAKIIYGEVSPSGRLAETYPISHRKVPSFYTFANDL